jgi:uncharacterized membrane protein
MVAPPAEGSCPGRGGRHYRCCLRACGYSRGHAFLTVPATRVYSENEVTGSRRAAGEFVDFGDAALISPPAIPGADFAPSLPSGAAYARHISSFLLADHSPPGTSALPSWRAIPFFIRPFAPLPGPSMRANTQGLDSRWSRASACIALVSLVGCGDTATTAPEVPDNTSPPPAYEVRIAGPVQSGATVGLALNNHGVVVGEILQSGPPSAFRWDEAGVTPLRYDAMALGVNDNGMIVGTAADLGATLWHEGTATALSGWGSAAFAVNGDGIIAGSVLRNSRWQPVLWKDGETVLEGFEEQGEARSIGISNSGYVVGIAGEGLLDAFRWKGGDWDILPRLDGTPSSLALSVNNHGDVVGSAGRLSLGFAPLPVRWKNGQVAELPMLPGADFAVANGINDHGVIVGTSYSYGTTPSRAVVWCRDRVFSLTHLVDDPALYFERAHAINNSGQITGAVRPIPGDLKAFVLTPVAPPEECRAE